MMAATLTNDQIVSRLLKSDLTNLRNVKALFDMARNMDDLALCLKARQHAQRLVNSGDIEA